MSESKSCNFFSVISSLILGAALIVSGFTIGKGLMNFRNFENTVNVKGLATKDVEADLAVWTIKHTATGDVLADVQRTIQSNSVKIDAYLKRSGLQKEDILTRKLEVTDLLAQPYRPENVQSRYIVSEIILVQSPNVDLVDKAFQNQGEILAQNISLVAEQGLSPIEYIFTGLNDIKPEMIAEATKNARESAQQFARDTGANVGGLQYASQGVFQIFPRNSENSYDERRYRYKTVRVVSTLQFYIEG